MASGSRFSDVSEDELGCILEKAIPEKTKAATKYGIKIFQGKNLIKMAWVLYCDVNKLYQNKKFYVTKITKFCRMVCKSRQIYDSYRGAVKNGAE